LLVQQPERPCKLLIRSDSCNAIKWVKLKAGSKAIISPKASQTYRDAVTELLSLKANFTSVKGEWRGRAESVRLFGH
jgi:hypothetical protein